MLIIINDAPYGTEKAYNALRLATTILKEYEGTELGIFTRCCDSHTSLSF